MRYLEQDGRTENLELYLSSRMDFFQSVSNEALIFFEALLTPPPHLTEDINAILSEFNMLNEKIYLPDTSPLLYFAKAFQGREALSYFRLMQLMLNGYFSSPGIPEHGFI